MKPVHLKTSLMDISRYSLCNICLTLKFKKPSNESVNMNKLGQLPTLPTEIWEGLKAQQLFLWIDRIGFRHLGQNASKAPPLGGVSGKPIREEVLGQTYDRLNRLYSAACLETPEFPAR